MREVTNPQPRCVCTFPLSFSRFHQNQYDIAHCPEHSPKCGNSSNNPAFCSYLVRDKHSQKCRLANNHNIQGWKPPFCTPRPSVSQCSRVFGFFFQSMLKLFLQSCSTDRSNTSLARNPGWTLFFRSLPLCWFLTVCCVSFAHACRAWVMMEFTVHRRCLVLSLTTPSDSHHVDLLILKGKYSKNKGFVFVSTYWKVVWANCTVTTSPSEVSVPVVVVVGFLLSLFWNCGRKGVFFVCFSFLYEGMYFFLLGTKLI